MWAWYKVMRASTQEENHVVRKYLLSGAPYIDDRDLQELSKWCDRVCRELDVV